MTQTDIFTAIYTKLSAVDNLPQKIYENVKPPTTIEAEYLEIYIMPLPSETYTFNYGESKSGLIQVNVVVELYAGTIRPAQITDLILAAFKNGTVIVAGLKVSKPPYASPGMPDDVRYIVPITIQYENLTL